MTMAFRGANRRTAEVDSISESHVLTLTGERTLPHLREENYWFRRHEVAYLAVTDPAVSHHAVPVTGPNTTVLDAGCGEGYGAQLLTRTARQVVAVDCDPAVTGHVSAGYPDLTVLRANLVALPLGDATVDLVVSLQVIEHLWDQSAFLAECARVLRPGGALVVSTPNRLTFSPGRDTPLNPFHTRELTAAELTDLLTRAGLRVHRMLGVRHGSRLRDLDRRHGGLVAAQLATPASDWPAALRQAVVSVTARDFTLDEHDLDTSLDLFAVATLPR